MKPRSYLDVTRSDAGRKAVAAATAERAERAAARDIVPAAPPAPEIKVVDAGPIIPRPCVPVRRYSRITTWASACMGDGVIYFGTGWELVPS